MSERNICIKDTRPVIKATGLIHYNDINKIINSCENILSLAKLARVDSSFVNKLNNQCENLVLSSRRLVKKDGVENKTVSFSNIELAENFLTVDNFGLHINIHTLLPALKLYNRTNYLWDTYYSPLLHKRNELFKDNYIRPDTKSVIIYVHHNDIDSSRDYENYDTKHMTDVICAVFLKDDSQKYLEVYHTSVQSKEAYTTIHVIPKKRFVEFYEKELM